jgi:hypothetical protein
MNNLPSVLSSDRIEEIKKMMWDIPFGNTRFQIEHFLREHTAERQIRMILLQISEKITSLEKFKLSRQRLELDLEEIQEKIEKAEGRDRRRFELDLEEKRIDYNQSLKLVNDTLEEVKIYDSLLKEAQGAVGEVTRDNFEQAEQKYWELRLLDDARANMTANGSLEKGVIQSLQKIGLTAVRSHEGISFLTNEQMLQLEEKSSPVQQLEKKDLI